MSMSSEPIPISSARKPFRREGLGYVWDVAEHNVEFRADYIGSRSDEMHAEVTVRLGGRHLHMARFNLSSTTSRRTLHTALNGVTKGVSIPWETLVEQFSVTVLRKEREGEATRHTAQAEKRRLVYLVDDLVIRGKTNMLFAPGGSGKGMLCVCMCCAVASKMGFAGLCVMQARPFYFDWEDDFETFEDRLNLVARGFGVDVPRIPYRRMRGLAADRINEMARAIADEGADFGVVDSFSAAGGTVSDRTSWDTIAHRLFDALDQVPGMTWLIIDHVTGDKLKDPSGKAYGSIQKMNRVRNAWELRSEQEPGDPDVHMRLYDAKWNHTGRRKPRGARMEFHADRVTFHQEDASIPLTAPAVSLADKMALTLDEKGPLSTGVLASLLEVEPVRIRTELNRHRDRFTRDDREFIRLRQLDQDTPAEAEELPWQ